jgi:CYTH domain-containing protein
MSATRRFLIASSLARLVHRELGGTRVTEGYFHSPSRRRLHVRVEGETGSLILVTEQAGTTSPEERTEVPRAHAEALLDVAAGKVTYARSDLNIGGQDIFIDRFTTPAPLDLIAVEFADEAGAHSFTPLPWFGAEVTAEAAYQTRAIALQGLPEAPEDAPLSDTALNSVLDVLENRFAPRWSASGQATVGSTTVNALHQFAASFGRPLVTNSPETSPLAPNEARAEPVKPTAGPVNAVPDPDAEDDAIRRLARSLRPQRNDGGQRA